MLLEEDFARFDGFVKDLMQKPTVIDSIKQPANVNQCPSTKNTLYEYYFDLKKKTWIAYGWIVPQYIHDVELKINEIFVPNADSVRINHIVNLSAYVSNRHLCYHYTQFYSTTYLFIY